MTTDHQKMLEAAAKACGLVYVGRNQYSDVLGILVQDTYLGSKWFSPISHSADTASMCAKLEIETVWGPAGVFCIDGQLICADAKHDGTPEGKEGAWRLAASIVAAKVGGYEHE